MSVIIGLTGQSGAGKTTICDKLRDEGFGIINCDEVARECTADGSDCNKELSSLFPDCFDDKFAINRRAISKIIFSDTQKLKEFDDIVYPYINRLIDKCIEELSENYDYIVLDAPTLFEASKNKKCDTIIGVIAKKSIRLKRITARDNISEELALKRFSSQYDSDFFRENCEYIIENNGTVKQANQQTVKVIELIKESVNG